MIFTLGCGQERNNKPLPKIEVLSKSLIDTDKEYLYVPSTDQVSRTTRIGRPFWQGEPKIVKFQFEKDFLVAYAQEKDERFSDNLTNSKPVFRIPITHIDYRESRDAFGEGTNVEEENKYVAWNKRKYFEPKPQSFEFSDINTLPIEMGEIFGSTCATKNGQSELSFDVAKDKIDIVIKRDYKANYFCAGGIEELSDLAWSEITQYSIIPMDQLVSEDYETIEYDRSWERTFGFFDTLDTKVDSSNNSTQDQEIYYMNRWNPKREVITYHLDPRFEKPENKSIKLATLKSFQRLNSALATAGVKFRIRAVDGDADLRPGDLSKSSIVLVEDPLAVGLLGYGPSVANPRTGEIVQARTVMYPGVMKQFIRRAYDELYNEDRRQQEAEKNATASVASKGAGTGSQQSLSPENLAILNTMRDSMAPRIQAKKNIQWKSFQGELTKLNDLDSKVSGSELSTSSGDGSFGQIFNPVQNRFKDLVTLGAESFFNDTEFSIRSIFEGFKVSQESKTFDIDKLDAVEILSKNNMFPATEEAFVDIKDGDLKDTILGLGRNRSWEDLDEESRKEIVDVLMPYVWIPTLIHEVGHNLGLRHNFAGSEDKDNFYTEEEINSLGVDSEFGMPYSSMMEYTKSEITGLRIPGKYDVAALRYGYLQKVELQDGSIVPVAKTAAEMETKKEFGYCTDEGVSLNPNCNRFDDGTGYVEIANSIIDSYYENYKLRNFRSGRANFSMIDDIMYASRINSQFKSLRLMLERFTDIMVNYDLPLSQVEGIPWLKEMNDGAKIAANFLQSVVAEADYSCVIFTKAGAYSSVARLSDLDVSGLDKTCADHELSDPNFEIVGELGRSYNNKKYRDNENIYLDQIDVRGIWIDKLFALRYLVARDLNNISFDDNTLSYLDHPEIGADVNKFLKDMLVGNVVSKTKVKFNDGTETDFEYAHNFSRGYEINRPILPYVHWALKLPYEQMDLVDAVLIMAKDNLNKGLDSISNQEMRESLEVGNEYPQDGRDPAIFNTLRLGKTTFVAAPENEVANEVFEKINKVAIYDSVTRARLIEIFNLLREDPLKPLPIAATPSEVKVYNKGIDDLYLYLVGEMPTQQYYARVLDSLLLTESDISNFNKE